MSTRSRRYTFAPGCYTWRMYLADSSSFSDSYLHQILTDHRLSCIRSKTMYLLMLVPEGVSRPYQDITTLPLTLATGLTCVRWIVVLRCCGSGIAFRSKQLCILSKGRSCRGMDQETSRLSYPSRSPWVKQYMQHCKRKINIKHDLRS